MPAGAHRYGPRLKPGTPAEERHLSILLRGALIAKIEAEARERRVDPAHLLERLIEAVAEDRIWTAVIDGWQYRNQVSVAIQAPSREATHGA